MNIFPLVLLLKVECDSCLLTLWHKQTPNLLGMLFFNMDTTFNAVDGL